MVSAGLSVPAPLRMRAGTPTAVHRGGTGWVTSDPAAILEIGSDLHIADHLRARPDQDASPDFGVALGWRRGP